jgi:hypothetical protein
MGILHCFRFSRQMGWTVVLALFCSITPHIKALNSAPTHNPASPAALLPDDFAGWQLTGEAKHTADATAADPASAAVLKECGFTDASSGNFTRNGEKLSIRALRFQDVTGAYCAYTFYRHSGWPKEDIGRGGSSDNNRVLFWTGNVVVDANFDHVTPMSAAELRELAKELPQPAGNTALPPPLPSYMPQAGLEPQSTHYAVGPEGYVRSGGVLPPTLVDFTRGAETLTGTYRIHGQEGVLTIISYPTPQLAGDRARAIEAFLKAGNSPQAAWPQGLVESSVEALQVRRSGPYVAVTSGYFTNNDAHHLLGSINYQAEVTWNQNTATEVTKTARLLLGIFALIAILGGTALLLGIFFGGGRALYRRMRGKPISTMEEAEFIRLNLRK